MRLLDCAVRNYHWGKRGNDSTVAQLLTSAQADFQVDPSQPYAELWLGTHASGASKIKATGELLSDYLSKDSTSNAQLPFLFKVLSVDQALSIQVHPTKEQAVVLRAKDPKNYSDDNHKPEMAIALTPFELLCGFRPTAEICQFVRNVPELNALIGNDSLASLEATLGHKDGSVDGKAALKCCFSALMTASEASVKESIGKLVSRLAREESAKIGKSLRDLLLRLNRDFPADVGVFAPFFLNYFTLQPGESVFLGPNEPHAYLLGDFQFGKPFSDCIECMACSDNTIRAGLTPKFRDVPTLLQSLTYRMAGVEANKFRPIKLSGDSHVTVYDPPVPEWTVHRIELSEPMSAYELAALPVCSLLVVTEGAAQLTSAQTAQWWRRGTAALVEANECITLDAPERFVAFRAFESV